MAEVSAEDLMNQSRQIQSDFEAEKAAKTAKPTEPDKKPATAAPKPQLGGTLGKVVGIAGKLAPLAVMHDGGKVPGKEGEDVPIMAQAGETVLPAGRNSDYRKVFLSRMKAKSDKKE
jgi:hypothetical protein